MKPVRTQPATIDEYIAGYPSDVQVILRKIRLTIRKSAPDAEEKISYRLPTFTFKGILVHFGGFKNHIGFFPPVRDAKLQREAARYAGPKGNLRFLLDEPIPYTLIGKIVKARLRENLEKEKARQAKKRSR